MTTSNWDKFRLLLWKNWVLQWNHKRQLLIELLMPVLFAMILVFLRMLVTPTQEGAVHYSPVSIDNLDPLRASDTPVMLRWQLAYSPRNPLFESIVSQAASKLQLKVTSHNNSADLELYLRANNILAGVQFEDSMVNITDYPKHFAYSLRFPSELRTSNGSFNNLWRTNQLYLEFPMGGPRNPDDIYGGPGYIREGFAAIQHALSMAYIQLVSGNETGLPDVVMQRYPYPAYLADIFLQQLDSFVALLILLSLNATCTHVVKYITNEKEKQLKEVMKIMGLNNWIHWAAWFVKSFLMMGFSALLIVVMFTTQWSNDNLAVFPNSDVSAVLFFFLTYIVATVTFCFMISACFSRASTAAAVTGLIWFIAFLPYLFTLAGYSEVSLSAKLFLSLFSNTGMGYGVKLIMQFEASGEGLQWSNLFQPVSVDDTLTVGYIILMTFVDAALYMLICLYIEQIFPGNFGVPKKWNFPFQRNFWCGEPEYNGVDVISNGEDTNRPRDGFESEPIGKRVGLQVKNLRKEFNGKIAVNGLSMNMYEDEITVLLGHNGAGKTTTISMLTGMIVPTSGTAVINGDDIRTNTDAARMSLGICPQHNILFDDLTVKDHIVFFSRLKGLKGEAVDREVEKYVRILQLENKVNVASSKLSGGMKRKLSVGAALCGGTKVVLCDEPSSGMDPAARRQLWDLLQAEKAGRTILLTTHFMDEADVLGDRIAIMCDGDLKCCGTSFFLKKKFGSGYILICVKKDDCDSSEVTDLLRKYIPQLEIESEIGAELSYHLPDEFSHIFEEMFGDLEEKSDNLNLNGYGVTITSLEEVFMRVGAEKNSKSESEVVKKPNGVLEDDVESMSSDRVFASDMSRLLKGPNLMLNQWKAMFLKKFIYTRRNLLIFSIQNIMPIFFVAMTITLARTYSRYRPLNPLHIELSAYDKSVVTLETPADVTTDSIEAKIANEYQHIIQQNPNSEFVRISTDLEKYIMKLSESILVRVNSRYVAAATVSKGHIKAWLNNQPLHTAPLTLNLVHNALARAFLGDGHSIDVTNAPLPFNKNTLREQLATGNNMGSNMAMYLCFCMSFVSSLYVLFVVKERVSGSKLLQFVGGTDVLTFWMTQFLADMLTLFLTVLITIITMAIFQEDGYATLADLARVGALLMLFACAVLPLTYLLSFWFTEPATGFARLTSLNVYIGMALFMVITIMSSPKFDTKDIADTLTWVFLIFPHFSLAMGLNKLYANTATRNICQELCKITAPFLPNCDVDLMCTFEKFCCVKPFFGWEKPGILSEVAFLVLGSICFFLLLLIIDYRLVTSFIFKLGRMVTKTPLPPPENDYFDEDVSKEKERVQNMSPDEIGVQNLVLNKVTKYYGKFLAVNQVSVGIRHSECFGLLGVNGAGKTTTFKMMTGDEQISSGRAFVKGISIQKNMKDVYKEIGYCPQFDALLEDLTGKETILIFCLLRGISSDRIPLITDDLAKALGFHRHLNKQAKAYSGGNKRKLSTAISLIGSPSVVYLDEPTTGMDPAARRQVWNVVCKVRDAGKSIVLTSHSMEECEALCTRLAIMVNGEFKCIGSTQHLKNKFSKGLVLKLKLRKGNESTRKSLAERTSNSEDSSQRVSQIYLDDIENVKVFVQTEFPEAVLQEQHQGILTFYIPLASISWSKIFGLVERNRDHLNIEDYSISQTTLEQIFLEFAKYQREDPREVNDRRGILGFRRNRRR